MDIDDIYNMIPDFQCAVDCHECCQNFGVPSGTKVEDERAKAFLQKNSMDPGKAHGNTCTYLSRLVPRPAIKPILTTIWSHKMKFLCLYLELLV